MVKISEILISVSLLFSILLIVTNLRLPQLQDLNIQWLIQMALIVQERSLISALILYLQFLHHHLQMVITVSGFKASFQLCTVGGISQNLIFQLKALAEDGFG